MCTSRSSFATHHEFRIHIRKHKKLQRFGLTQDYPKVHIDRGLAFQAYTHQLLPRLYYVANQLMPCGRKNLGASVFLQRSLDLV
jgi:hypothetical protein